MKRILTIGLAVAALNFAWAQGPATTTATAPAGAPPVGTESPPKEEMQAVQQEMQKAMEKMATEMASAMQTVMTAMATSVAASVESATSPVAPTEQPAAAATEPETPNEIEIGYIDADIQKVLRTLAAKAGVNLIIGDEVTGTVTVNLKGVDYEEAMRLIAESKGYAVVKEKNVIKVKSREALEVEPVQVQIFTLNYAKADDVKKTIDPVLSKQGKSQVDVRSNTLIIFDTPSSLTKLSEIVRALDTQTPQVMIEAKFVETQLNPKKDLGINWSGVLLNHELTAGGSALADEKGMVKIPVDGANKPIGGFQWIKPFGDPAFSPWSAGAALLDAGRAQLVFSYLAQDENTELLANPRVVTTDNGKAKISISQQFPIPNYAYSESQGQFLISGFEYKDIGIVLNVTPRINKDEFITLEVTPEVSDSEKTTPLAGGGAVANIPIVNTRMATTTVLIRNGNTLAIGGLTGYSTRENYTKVPIMGDLPGVGALFRSKSLEKKKRELLIFLTPTIVRADGKTGYEQFSEGFPQEELFVNDKWMPRDNAKAPGQRHKPRGTKQNFTAK